MGGVAFSKPLRLGWGWGLGSSWVQDGRALGLPGKGLRIRGGTWAPSWGWGRRGELCGRVALTKGGLGAGRGSRGGGLIWQLRVPVTGWVPEPPAHLFYKAPQGVPAVAGGATSGTFCRGPGMRSGLSTAGWLSGQGRGPLTPGETVGRRWCLVPPALEMEMGSSALLPFSPAPATPVRKELWAGLTHDGGASFKRCF